MYQCITLAIESGDTSWTCSGIYASPNFSSRCCLWDYLNNLRASIIGSWTMLGDFNDIILPS